MKQFLIDYKLPIAIILVIVLCSFGGSKGWKYHKATLKTLEDEKQKEIVEIQIQRDSLQYIVDDGFANNEQLTQIQKTYYNEFINERRARIKAERLLQDITYRVYSYKHLDSLKSNVTYPKN